MKHLIESYLESKKNAWSESTLRSERSRLTKLLQEGETAEALFNRLVEAEYKPYSIKTAFIRLSKFWAEAMPGTDNPYQSFMRLNRRLFSNAYQRVSVDLDFEEIKLRLSTIKDENLRAHCIAMLKSGVRISEAAAVENGLVSGKGGKIRRIYNAEGLDSTINKDRVSRALAKLGLKPHDLRKAFATECARRGMDAPTLCLVMGWSNIQTAFYYLQPMREDAVAAELGEL